MGQTGLIVEYFGDQNAVSFSKTIPRRPVTESDNGFRGSYDGLARQSLASALEHKSADGSVQLLDIEVVKRRLVDLIQGTPKQVGLRPEQAVETEEATMYTEGIATTLWKLGFMTVDSEDRIPYGDMKVGKKVTTTAERQGPIRVHHMKLPFDATNELHTMLAQGAGMPAPAFVEVETSIIPYPSFAGSAATPPSMTLRLIEQRASENHIAA